MRKVVALGLRKKAFRLWIASDRTESERTIYRRLKRNHRRRSA